MAGGSVRQKLHGNDGVEGGGGDGASQGLSRKAEGQGHYWRGDAKRKQQAFGGG